MKRKWNLQLFADDPAEVSDGTAEEAQQEEAAADRQEEPERKPKYTDADVDRIIDRKFAEWQRKQQRAVDEAKRLGQMDAQQKAEYERDQLKKQLEEYQRKDTLAEMSKTARGMLSDRGISIADELLAMLVSTDADQTKAAVDAFGAAFQAAVEETVKTRLQGRTPRKSSAGQSGMTKEQIGKIRDPNLRQMAMLEHRELYPELNKNGR